MFRQCMLATLPLLAASASLSSCGHDSDHLSGVTVAVSPDPLRKDATFTITFDGTLDKDLSTVNANVDLDVSILGLITESVKTAGKVVLSPVIPNGPLSVTVGPVKLSTSIPGSIDVSGKIELTDENEEPVACLQVDMKVPLSQEEQELQGAENCGKSSDHAKDFEFHTDAAGVTTITGELDESVSQFSVDVDVQIKEFFLKIPVSLSAPVTYTPVLPEGPFKIVASSTSNDLSAPELSVSVSGTAKMNDANNEEIGCISFDNTAKALVV